ncbi:MAG: class II fumarate hydratase [Clostridia bacterium]|nr:class II fumarate hydratase [Clostridia bacterium]
MEENYRIEKDSMGEMKVPADKLWGAQTARSLKNFRIGGDLMPSVVVHALAMLKQAAATANRDLGKLDEARRAAISEACAEVFTGKLDAHFPLSVWQTGSGTQTNMNVNEVVANRAMQLHPELKIHPNDHVNMSQSSNDTFPSAISVSAVLTLEGLLLPAAEKLVKALSALEERYAETPKAARTHMQDAVPMTFGQEASGWRAAIESDIDGVQLSLHKLRALPIGGTAVGNGLNCPDGFDEAVCAFMTEACATDFYPCENKFAGLGSKNAVLAAHGALKTLAADLHKLASDVRLLGSGPRCGIGELKLPANEPGSSIMPGKVNPTQCEALIMVCHEVFGNDAALTGACAAGVLELNVCMPLIAFRFLRSVYLLTDAMTSFTDNCLAGLTADEAVMREYLERSLMTVTRLTPVIGYDAAAKAAKCALEENITLREAVVGAGLMDADKYDEIMKI